MRNSCYFLLITLFFLSACKTADITERTMPVKNDIRYSVIYVIHGDGDYLFHDDKGQEKYADVKVLKEAQKVGVNAENGEVFIYHIKPEQKFLWLFPLKDRRSLHYRNGELIADSKYSPDLNNGIFASEYNHYRKNRVQSSRKPEKVFLYFGHEIPAVERSRYYRSQPNIRLGTKSFAESLKGFLTNDNDRFSLSVISTCNNGTPQMAALLSPFTNYLLASPQNLHLSHIDTENLMMLEDEDVQIKTMATQMAESTFQRMSQQLQTAITLSLYDLNEVGNNISSFSRTYMDLLEVSEFNPYEENIDCMELPIFEGFSKHNGLSRWYRPPLFGRGREKEVHSGWGCKNLNIPKPISTP